MATGDALDQVLAEVGGLDQQQQQRRVPAPQRPVSPVQANAGGRAAPSVPPTSAGGPPSLFSRVMSSVASVVPKALDTIAPGLGSVIGLGAKDPAQTARVAEGIGAGVLRSPVTAAAGIADFAGDVGGAVAGPKGDFRNYQGHISPAGIAFRYAPQDAETISGFSKRIDPLSQVGNPTANEVASNVASLAVGYGAGAKLAEYSGLAPRVGELIGKFGNPAAQAAASLAARAGGLSLVDAVVMDPETQRFSNILQQLGVHTEFTDWLAAKPGDDHMASRFKNAVEGLGLGAAADGIFNAGNYWHARLTGDNASADAIQGQLAAKHDGEVPDYTVTEHTGAPPTPPEPSYVGGWETAPDGAVRPVYEKDPLDGAPPGDTAAAEDSGVAPQGSTDGGSSGGGGKQPADGGRPETSAAMADTGSTPETSSGATGPETSPPVSFNVKRTPDDPGTVVGPLDRTAIEGLAKDVRSWRAGAAEYGDRELDVTHADIFGPAAQHGEWRLGNLGSADNVAPTLRAIVDQLPETAPRSDAELFADVARASAETGNYPAAMLEAARLISGKLSDADTAMALVRTFWKKSADDLDSLPNMNWESASQDDVEKTAQRIYNMMAIGKHVQDAKAALGRGLRVNQLPDAETYLNTVKRADNGGPPIGDVPIGPLPRTRQEVQTWMDAWEATKNNPELRADMLEGALTRSVPSPGQYLRQSFPNFFTAAVLSAPRTHLLGFTGPVLMSILRNTERLSGGFLAAIGNPFLSTSERQLNLVAASKTSFNYVSTLQSLQDAMHWATKAAYENKSQLHAGMEFDAARTTGPVNPALAQAAGYNPNDIRYALGNAINIFPRAIARLYNFTDELTQRLAYYNEVRANATIEGAQQGLNGDDLHEFVRGKLKESTNTDPTSNDYGAATAQTSLDSAQRNSFLGPVGSEGTAVRRMADGINGMRRDYPELRYILPVFNVPANILGEIIRRTPLAAVPGFGFTQTAKALKGELGPLAQAEAHGRMLTGAAFLTSGLLLSRAGLLTGAGPQEGTARKDWLLEHEPWSLRVGDSWVRLDKYDTMGGLLTLPATVADATQYVKQDEKVGDLLMSSIGALAEWFKDRASMRTAASVFSIGDDPTQNVGNALSHLTAQTAAGFIPNALQTLVTQQMDPVLRRKEAWLDYLKAAIPGLSAAMPPVRNVLGEPVNRAADTLGEAVFPVTIAPAVTFKTDSVIDEIDRLYHTTGYAAGADPKALGYGYFHPTDVTLENGQSLYDAFMQARQTMTVNGLTLRQSLDKLFASQEYNQAVDADPGAAHTSRGDASRGYMVEQVFNVYNKQVKAELADASPTANKWLTAAAAKQRDDAYLRDVNVEDLVNNPGYYQSHGIDGAQYSAKVREGATGSLTAALRRR